jgi:hypothetical protein
MDSVSHVRHIEVQKKPELVTGQFEIGQELGAMNGQYPLDAFELDDEATFDDEIHPVCRRQLDTFVHDGQMNLMLELRAGLRQFVVEAGVARAFEHACPEGCEREEPLL